MEDMMRRDMGGSIEEEGWRCRYEVGFMALKPLIEWMYEQK